MITEIVIHSYRSPNNVHLHSSRCNERPYDPHNPVIDVRRIINCRYMQAHNERPTLPLKPNIVLGVANILIHHSEMARSSNVLKNSPSANDPVEYDEYS